MQVIAYRQKITIPFRNLKLSFSFLAILQYLILN